MAQVEEDLRKTVVTKEDGRYLIFYDFIGTERKTDGRQQRQQEEEERRNVRKEMKNVGITLAPFFRRVGDYSHPSSGADFPPAAGLLSLVSHQTGGVSNRGPEGPL